MKSAPLALTWEFWFQHKFMLPFTLGSSLAVVVLPYYCLRLVNPAIDPSVASILHTMMFVFVVPVAVIGGTALGDIPTRRFGLPVPTWSLVFWPMISGLIYVGGSYLLLALFANALFDARWPLLKPTLAAECIFALSYALALIIVSGQWSVPLSISSAACSCIVTVWLNQATIREGETPYWESLTTGEVLLGATLMTAAYIGAVAGIGLARRGQPLSLIRLGRWLVDNFAFHAKPPQSFRSAGAAQRWLEWRQKGLSVPAIAAFPALVLCVWFSTGWLDKSETVTVVAVFSVMGVMVSPLVGWLLGNSEPRFNISEFIATRPMTSTELADITLINAAKSLCCGWVVWWVGAGLALCCATWSGSGPTSPRDLFLIDAPPGTWLQATLYFAALFGGVLLTSWTLISLGVAMVLLRLWMFSAILCVLILSPVSIAVAFPPPVNPNVAAALQISVIGLISAVTIGVYVAAYRLKLIGTRRIATVMVLYLITMATAVVCLPENTVLELTFYRGLIISISALPFLSLAATPLAFWWNRHR